MVVVLGNFFFGRWWWLRVVSGWVWVIFRWIVFDGVGWGWFWVVVGVVGCVYLGGFCDHYGDCFDCVLWVFVWWVGGVVVC